MPKLTIWSGRLALIYLVVGWTLGALLMLNRAWIWSAEIWDLLQLHGAMVLFGWTFQLVIAVAYWILPTFGGRDNRGREWAAWTSVAAVNAGVTWVVVSVFFSDVTLVVAAILWLVSVACFGWHAWPRVKAYRRS